MLNEQSPHANPPLILITGMHRSGTSLLGSILPACGVTMPGPLISGDHNNPEGYFERSDITEMQEQLLIDLAGGRLSTVFRSCRTIGYKQRPVKMRPINSRTVAGRTVATERAMGDWDPAPACCCHSGARFAINSTFRSRCYWPFVTPWKCLHPWCSVIRPTPAWMDGAHNTCGGGTTSRCCAIAATCPCKW